MGYIRVSTKEQNEGRQWRAMHEFGIADRDLFMNKQSGKNFERPNYKKLIRKLKPGDTLVIKSIDRLGRNYEEILEQWRVITGEKKAAIVVLDMPLLDTRQGRDLTGMLIADIVLQLLSYVAQTEPEFIRQRQTEGIAAAKARGVYMGRAPMEVPDAFASCMTSGSAERFLAGAQRICSEWHNTHLQNGPAHELENFEQKRTP